MPELEKYRELHQRTIDLFDENNNVFDKIDSKAFNLLSVLTLLVPISGYFGSWVIKNIEPPISTIEYLIYFFGVLYIIFLICSWVFVFKVIKIRNLSRVAYNEKMIDFYRKNDLIDIYLALSKSHAKAFEENHQQTKDKTKCFITLMDLIHITGFLLIAFMVLYLIQSFL